MRSPSGLLLHDPPHTLVRSSQHIPAHHSRLQHTFPHQESVLKELSDCEKEKQEITQELYKEQDRVAELEFQCAQPISFSPVVIIFLSFLLLAHPSFLFVCSFVRALLLLLRSSSSVGTAKSLELELQQTKRFLEAMQQQPSTAVGKSEWMREGCLLAIYADRTTTAMLSP